MYVRGNPLRYNDPSGHCVDGISTVVCVAATLGLAGGTANAVGNLGGQIFKNYQSGQSLSESVSNVRYGEVGIAFGAGFVSGASAPFTGGIGGAIVTNALIGGVQNAATQMLVDGKSVGEINTGDVAVGVTLGAMAGGVQGALLKSIPAKEAAQSGLYGGSKVITSLGTSSDPYIQAVAPKSASVFQQTVNSAQIGSTVSARSLAGVAVANAPVPSTSCGGVFSCMSENIGWAWNGVTNFFTGK